MEEDQDMLQACVEDLTAIIDKNGKADLSSFTFWPRFDFWKNNYFFSQSPFDIYYSEKIITSHYMLHLL